jgi:hypothetical protein
MRRFAAAEEKNVVMEFDWPKIGEPRLPVGVPRFTLLKIFRALTLKVRV